MKSPKIFFQNSDRYFIFVAAFLLAATSLMAFPGEPVEEEKRNEQQERVAQDERMRDGTEDESNSPEEIEKEFQWADEQLTAWNGDKSSILRWALADFIGRWENKIQEYSGAYNESKSKGDAAEAERNLGYFHRSQKIKMGAMELQEPATFQNSALESTFQEDAEISQPELNQAPVPREVLNRAERNRGWFSRGPSWQQIGFGILSSYCAYRVVNKHIPEFLSSRCHTDSLLFSKASWHPCYGFPTLEDHHQLAVLRSEINRYMPSMPLLRSLVAGDYLLTPPYKYYGDDARSVDCGEGKDFCYAFLPRESVFVDLSKGVDCPTYNTSCYKNLGGTNKILKHFISAESQLQKYQEEISTWKSTRRSEVGYYATRAWNAFTAKFENIKNLYAAAHLTMSAKKERSLAFITRQVRTSLTHDRVIPSNSDGALVISANSQKIRAALDGEKAQHDQALSTWKKAREAYEQGHATAPEYSQKEWLSKEHWRYFFQDLTYRMIELQYWQSHTLQRIFENNLRAFNRLGSEKLGALSDLQAENEAQHSQFTKAIAECYRLVHEISHVDPYSPYRSNGMNIRGEAGNSTFVDSNELFEVITQRVKLLCDTFEESLQKNHEKNQRAIKDLQGDERDLLESQAF